MFSRTQAQQFAATFRANLPARVERFLLTLSGVGSVGGVFVYSLTADDSAEVARTVTQLAAAGWAVVDNPALGTLTIT